MIWLNTFHICYATRDAVKPLQQGGILVSNVFAIASRPRKVELLT